MKKVIFIEKYYNLFSYIVNIINISYYCDKISVSMFREFIKQKIFAQYLQFFLNFLNSFVTKLKLMHYYLMHQTNGLFKFENFMFKYINIGRFYEIVYFF